MADLNIQVIETILMVFSFLIGSMIGSFLNVCVYRMPRDESVVKPRSKCPKCDKPIVWYDNIPMLSWLILGAKCRNCDQPISWQYPLVEAITGTLFLCVFLRFGMVIATPIYMLLAAGLVLVTFVDLSDWTIPNEVTIPGIFIGIGCSVVGMFYPESGLRVVSPLDAIGAGALGGGILYALDKISLLLLKKRGMGFGDVKLLAMLGTFIGWQSVLLNIVVASVLGSIVGITMIVMQRGKQTIKDDDSQEMTGHYLPFGPYLVVGGLIVLFFGPEIIEAYLNVLQVPAAAPTIPI